jgi:hypothetical protein
MARPGGITQDQSRLLGQAIMGLAVVQLVAYLVAATQRSYLAVAIPVGIAVGVFSGIAFWIGYTMAVTDWDRPADYLPDEDDEVAEAEGAPPPETIG